jgi:hypothetical protein
MKELIKPQTESLNEDVEALCDFNGSCCMPLSATCTLGSNGCQPLSTSKDETLNEILF